MDWGKGRTRETAAMSDKKKSIVEAINSMASLGAVFAGEVAGQSVETEMTRTLEDLPEQVQIVTLKDSYTR